MPIRITGLNSNLDTESIISALVSSYNYKTEKYKKAQTKLSWKQDAWKTLNSKIYSLYQSLDGLRFSKGYNLKSAKCSDSTKATVTADKNAVNGTQNLNIIRIAQAGYLTGAKLDGSVTTNTTLAELGYTGGDGKINVTKGDGTTTEVSVSQGTTVSSFMQSLNNAGVTASFDATNQRLYISSKETGADNDFTLTGANVDGANALSKLGINVKSDSTQATYESYAKYYYNGYLISNADGTPGTPTGDVSQNVKDALTAYQDALEKYNTASAQNGNLSAAYGYASAYSAMREALGSLTDKTEQDQLRTLLGMTATERVNSVMDADGSVYRASATDENGNTIYSGTDKAGNEKLIQRVITYSDGTGNSYEKNANGTLRDSAGNIYTATSKDGMYTAEDGTEVNINTNTTYNEVTSTQIPTGYYTYEDADGNKFTPNDTGTYVGTDGTQYRLDLAANKMIEVDADGNDVTDGKSAEIDPSTKKDIMKTQYDVVAVRSDLERSADVLTKLNEKSGLTEDEIKTLTSKISAVNAYENTEDTVLDSSDPNTRANIAAAIAAAYDNNGSAGVNALVNTYAGDISDNKDIMAASEKTMNEHSALADIAKMEDGTDKDNAIAAFVDKVNTSKDILATSWGDNSDAKKIDGQDAVIKLNGVEYKGSTNVFSINGLSISAEAVTGDGEANAITITTQTDTQGIYDNIKSFLTQYNSIINEITSLYNADSAKGYEPLSDEERDAMSDTEVEKWEAKIKSSLLRRDDSLESVMNSMTNAMSKGYEVNGKKYYLSSFGIKTLGFLNAPENQHNAYHIDGDEDDAASASKADNDALLKAITEDPDAVAGFMQQLTQGLYDDIMDKMKATSLSSTYTVYNDKEMASEYSDYTDLIKKWEEKLQAQEDYYYDKFTAMETALSKLNSQTSSLSSMFGS